MKKIFTLCVVLCLSYLSMGATNPKHEFRATWLTTAWGNDWPKTKVTNDATRKQQQDSLIAIFDRLQAGNMNAVCFQVRGRSDAFYQSSYEPWAAELAGARGTNPGYDPLAFAIEEAHKRGLELHAWVNPFRVTSAGTLDANDLVKKNAGQWIIQYNNGSFTGEIIDPGYPEAREYVLNVLMEIINNYDIDGIVMDDYFYPYGGTTTEDAESKALHKPANVVDVNQDSDTDDDWRRSNVDVFLKELYDRIQAKKPWVRFGMGTFGIWTTQSKVAQAYGISLPSGISGLDDYDVQACNPVEWVKNGYVDYINPQLYWPTTSTGQNYGKLCQWWAKDVCEHFSDQLTDGKKVHFFSSQSISSNSAVSEIQAQIDVNRNNLSSGSTGSVFFDTDAYLTMDNALMTSRFATHALPPAMDWKSNTALAAPTNLTVSGSTLTWQHATAERFTVYVYPKGTAWSTAKNDPAYLQGVIYGKSMDISGIDTNANDIAVCAYDRYGVEHGVALYNADPNATDDPEPEPEPEPEPSNTITWELNGGEVNIKTVEVPTNDGLWKALKEYYQTFYSEYRADQPITAVSIFMTKACAIMTDASSEYKWLGDYIMSVAADQGYTLTDDPNADSMEALWRWHVHSFLNCNQRAAWPSSADFSTAGQPSEWGPAYQIAHGAVLLPTYVTSAYTLPTPVHPSGYEFLGWYDNAEFAGSPLTTIPANWTGTLYAQWQENTPTIDPTWQITYTSSNDSIVTPYATDVFGANIVSNTYENGVGTITFDGPVTSIGKYAFGSCSSLTSITIPNSITSIGSHAFIGCSSLTSLTIPNSVTSIYGSAFFGCSSLTSMTVENGNTVYDSRENCNAIIETATNTLIAGCQNTIIPNSVTIIGGHAFSGCFSLTSITIPNSVTSIGDWAFSDCTSLASVVIPESVTSIGGYAFHKCYALTSITIPNSVTSIGWKAFMYCHSLTSITIPNSVTSIGDGAFADCSSLTSMTVENGNTVYDSRENCNAIIETATNTLIAGCQNTIIPNSVTSIGDYAFSGCDNLSSVIIPNSVTSIGDWAFCNCDNLSSVIIPNSVTSIGDNAFSSCSSLTSITIPNSVMSIGTSAFSGCSSLTSVTIPESLTSIGDYAFNSCSSLTSITIPNSVMSIGTSAFSGCSSLTSVTIPESLTSIGWCAFGYCSSLETIHVEATNPPILKERAFKDTPSPTCYIPCGTFDAYQSSDWAQYVGEFVEVCPTVVKAKVPAAWEDDDITVWVWTDGAGTEYPTTKEGDWYIYTHSDNTAFNIIFKSGTGWKGNTYQTVDINGITENTCLEIQPTNIKATYTIVDCPSIIYELNGGVTNDYDWMSKDDMYHELLVDINAIMPTTKVDVDTVTLAYSKTLSVEEGIPAWWTNLDPLLDDIHFMTKWGWLITYMDGICVEQDKLTQTPFRRGVSLRYNLAAFFIESTTHAWSNLDYSIAGKDDAYIPAWKHGYANPTDPTDEFVLNIPYRECYTFDGWYVDANFAGEQVITVDSSFNGTLYAKWVESDCPIANPVSWELEGGMSPVELPTHITSAYVLPTPTRDGYVFMGWYHDYLRPETSSFIAMPMTILPIGYTGTLYADWTKEPTDALNPFAYALSSELSRDKSQLLVNYSLNARAMDVQIVIMDGETAVKTIACDGLSKGSHSVAIPTAGLPEHKQLTWKVEVKGAEVTEPTEYAVNYSFYHPSAVDIDNNPENPTFGMILTNEGMHEVKDINGYLSTGYGAGIYAFNPAFEPMPNGSNPGYNGGIEFTNGCADDTTRIAYSPRRIRISEDGRIFVTSLNTDGNYLWEVNPENMNEWTSVFQGTLNDQRELVDAAGNFIAAPNAGFDVKGSGENLQLMMYSFNLRGITSVAMDGLRCDEYNLGTATTWTTAPSKSLVDCKYITTYIGTQVEYDNEGGIWIASYRGTATNDSPGLVHINAEGVEDCKLLWSNLCRAGIRFNNDFTKLVVAGNNGSANKATIYAVSKDANGAPVLTEEWVIDATYILGKNLNDFAFDYAGNLYACGNSTKNGEKIVAWAMPRSADEVVTTPAASKYNFTYSDDAITYELNGGVQSEWETPQAMYNELNALWNTFSGTSKTWGDLSTLKADVAKGIPTLAYGMALDFIADENFKEKFEWLVTYMDAKCTEQGQTLPSSYASFLRYNLQAFFIDGMRTSWPISADYTICGVSTVEAYQPYWKSGFANPTNPTEEFVLNAPYKEGYTFLGWYTNADFSGEKVTTINAETTGTLYAKWINSDWIITYTSTDGNIVTPYKTNVFGANIVSNTYENGVGTITFDGPVTSIGDYAFYNCSSLTSIEIPNSVTSIGIQAFQVCSSLTSITIPNSVTNIGYYAFSGCSSLTSITIPESVTSIGNFAFEGCSSLTSVTIPNSVTSIGNHAFFGCSSLSSINIPDGVTSIREYAFSVCSSLTSITIPNSVTSIGVEAFSRCSGLTSIVVDGGNTTYDSRENCNAIIETATNTLITGCQNTIIPNSVTSIGGGAFYDCSSLTSITIPNSVTSIGDFAFRGCSGLTSITIPNSVTSIGDWAFDGCSSLTSITIPESVTSIGSGAFYNCSGLTSITIPNSMTSIGSCAFRGCSGLTSVTIPNSVTSIGGQAFYSCSGLTSITIPNSVTSIGDWAFRGCSGLTSVTIPNSVTSIGNYAFEYCSSLDTIHIEAITPPTLGTEAVTSSPTCYIPCGTLSAYQASDWASQVSEFVEEGCIPVQQCGDDLYWEYADGVLTITGTGDMYDYADDKTGPAPWYDVRGSITTINMPNEMTKIGDYAFYKCTEVTSINMPTTLTAIGEKAFAQDTKLACEIILPASMTTIASRAFFNCQAVTAFHIEATTPPTIPNDAFERTTASIHVPCGYGHIYGKHAQWGELNLEMCELLQDNVYYYPIDGHTARAVTYHSNSTDTLVIPSAVVIDGMPRTVTEVAASAFADCKDIPAIIFSEGLEYIGERAFVRCYGLKGTIVLPATLETIGERAFSYCNNVEKYLIQAMTPPALGANAFTGDNKNALFYISCEAMDDYKVATNWSSLKSRLRDACLNIYHYNTALGANGVHTTEDTLVASIYYRRKFTTSRWETLYLPFEVDRVTVLEDGVEYDLNAWSIFSGGHYYLAKPYGIENKEVVFGFTQVVDAHTPYIIQFKEPYYHDKMITFHGKESWNKLNTSFEALPISFEMQMAGNTTLQDQILEEPVYMLRATSNFILQNTTTTLHPFECYVIPSATSSGAPARMSVRFRGDVPTAVESVMGNESRLAYTINGNTLTVYPQGQAFSIYSLNGALIYSCEAGKEAVDCELNSGCYLLHAGTEAHKIML